MNLKIPLHTHIVEIPQEFRNKAMADMEAVLRFRYMSASWMDRFGLRQLLCKFGIIK